MKGPTCGVCEVEIGDPKVGRLEDGTKIVHYHFEKKCALKNPSKYPMVKGAKFRSKFEKLVKELKAQGGALNPYAVATAALGGYPPRRKNPSKRRKNPGRLRRVAAKAKKVLKSKGVRRVAGDAAAAAGVAASAEVGPEAAEAGMAARRAIQGNPARKGLVPGQKIKFRDGREFTILEFRDRLEGSDVPARDERNWLVFIPVDVLKEMMVAKRPSKGRQARTPKRNPAPKAAEHSLRLAFKYLDKGSKRTACEYAERAIRQSGEDPSVPGPVTKAAGTILHVCREESEKIRKSYEGLPESTLKFLREGFVQSNPVVDGASLVEIVYEAKDGQLWRHESGELTGVPRKLKVTQHSDGSATVSFRTKVSRRGILD